MSQKNPEEVMMEADYSPGDEKTMSDGKENSLRDAPMTDESISQMSPKCKQIEQNEQPLRDTEFVNNGKENPDSDSESNLDGSKKLKKRHRRRCKGGKNHRKWKPYDKMSWSEKKELEEKETRRANQKREEAFASGHPVAPYNTTQFLMDDHFQNEAISPDLHRHNFNVSNGSNSTDSSSEFYEEDEENDGFQEKNFQDTFNDIRKQQLLDRSKEELVRDYVEMEMRLEKFQKDTNKKGGGGERDSSTSRESTDERKAEKEVNIEDYLQMKAENESLKETNRQLLAKLDGNPSRGSK